MDNVVFRFFFFTRSREFSRKGCGILLELVENAFCCFPQFQWSPSAGFGDGGSRGEGVKKGALRYDFGSGCCSLIGNTYVRENKQGCFS